MLRALITQLLPLFLALLGAVVGVLLSIFLGSPATSSYRYWCISISVLLGLVTMGIAYLICDQVGLERKVQAVTIKIRAEIGHASSLEYRIRGDVQNEAHVAMYVAEIETWRDRVIAMLQKELPNSGADIRFLTGTGEVGHGPLFYEYTRLVLLRGNLGSVLDNLPSYAQRSRS
jgi:hypothetical protein